MDTLLKNLWLTLTLAIPGIVTYGMWRCVVALVGYRGLDTRSLDQSELLTIGAIMTIALLQQTVGITIEAALYLVACCLGRNRWRRGCVVFLERFSWIAKCEPKEDALRTVGQFFASLNMCVGQLLVLGFLYWVDDRPPGGRHHAAVPLWLFKAVWTLIALGFATALFRFFNAARVLDQCLSDLERKAGASTSSAPAAC